MVYSSGTYIHRDQIPPDYCNISCRMQFQTSYVLDVIISILLSFTTATSRMTRFGNFHRSQTSMEFTWRSFIIPPIWIAVSFRCRHIINTTLYLAREVFLHPNQTSLTLNDLLPGTECSFILSTVYNPASIDSGIHTSCKTLPYSKTIRLYSFCV